MSRDVPRSPNCHLDQPGIVRQFEVAWRQIELDGFSDVCAGFLLGGASRRVLVPTHAGASGVSREKSRRKAGTLPDPGLTG
ncbi:MAG: hypothetical protein ACLQU1_28615 [Bryobacteraceae bacterium]